MTHKTQVKTNPHTSRRAVALASGREEVVPDSAHLFQEVPARNSEIDERNTFLA